MVILAQQDKPRERALQILQRVESGAFADALIDDSRKSFVDRDRSFILELVYGVLRNQTLLDWRLNQFSAQSVDRTDAWTRNILRLGAYQLLFLDRVPASAAVNTAAELAKEYGKKQGYVNGLLRNLDRKREDFRDPAPDDVVKRLSVLQSHPAWLVKRWVARYGAESASMLLERNNRPAPLVIRTNTLRTTREQLLASLEADGARAVATNFSPQGVEIIDSVGLSELTAFQRGWFMVQDQAAQLISLMLAPEPGDAVLDACAAPGGKATHMAEIMADQGVITALDSDPRRMGRIEDNYRRLGITCIRPVHGDAATYCQGTYDRILIDAPCSGLGVLRRHPDGRWNKDEGTIRERRTLQKRILDNCSALLKPGGVLVYATCTTEPEENEEVLSAFLSDSGAGFVLDDPRSCLPEQAARLADERGFLHTYPLAPEMDGFFGARLKKKG